MKRLQSSIVVLFDMSKVRPADMQEKEAEWAAIFLGLLGDAVMGQTNDGVALASPGKQLRVLQRPGRIEVNDYSPAEPSKSEVPGLLEAVLKGSVFQVNKLGLNHELELGLGEDAKGEIARRFLSPAVVQAVEGAGGEQVGAAIRLLFKDKSGSWNVHITPVAENTVRLSSNCERTGLRPDAEIIRREWQNSLDALMRYAKALKLQTVSPRSAR